VIGRRRLDPHIHALAELGASIDINGGYEMQTEGLRGRRIFLDEASVMATENAVMAASLAQGETVIGNAALRAARPGSLPLPPFSRRGDRRNRLERPHRPGRPAATGRRVANCVRARRGSRASSALRQ
jgi:hypothetical protein